MKAFSELTPRGQAGRLRAVARLALERYDLEPRTIRLVANHLNAIFRVDAADRCSYALRLSHPTWRTDEDLRSELMWLEALHRDTGIGAPTPFPARDGATVTIVTTAGVSEPRRCVLFDWIPGPLLADRLSDANLYQLGVLAARLHAHAAGFSPPPGFTTRRMNAIYARGEADVLFDDAQEPVFTAAQRQVFERVIERVRSTLDRLYANPQGLRVIHNDLHHENVKVFRGRLRPFDFEDTIWGYPVQDIAMTCFDLLDYTDPSRVDYRALRAAFQAGYISEAEWPEAHPGEIDTFIASRQVWRANWVVRYAREHAPRFVAGMASRFEVFLDTGAFPR